MPEARGDIREIVGEPVFIPLQKLALIYGKVCTSLPALRYSLSLLPDPCEETQGIEALYVICVFSEHGITFGRVTVA